MNLTELNTMTGADTGFDVVPSYILGLGFNV